MLSTPTAGINMQNRTAPLISLAASVAGVSVVGFLPPSSDGMRESGKTLRKRHGADFHTCEFSGRHVATTGSDPSQVCWGHSFISARHAVPCLKLFLIWGPRRRNAGVDANRAAKGLQPHSGFKGSSLSQGSGKTCALAWCLCKL